MNTVMDELEVLEHICLRDQEENNGRVTNCLIQLRRCITHLMTRHICVEYLVRPETKVTLICDLSSEEKEII